MKIQKMIGRRVLIQREEAEKSTKSGLLIAQNGVEPPQIGKVLAVGGLVEDVQVGDRIIFTKYGAVSVDGLDKNHFVLDEEDLLAKVCE